LLKSAMEQGMEGPRRFGAAKESRMRTRRRRTEIIYNLILSVGAAVALLGARPAHAQLRIVAESLRRTPEGSEVVYRRFGGSPAVGDGAGNQVAFVGRVQGGTVSPLGVYAEDGDPTDTGGGSTIAKKDQTSPTAANFVKFNEPSINANGRVTFSALLRAEGRGVFLDGITSVALKLDDAPTPAGTAFFASFPASRITDGGDVVFRASLGNAPVVLGVEVDQGVYRCSGGGSPNCSSQEGGSGTLTPVVLRGDLVGGRTICEIGEYAASSYGIAFRAPTQVDCTDTLEVPVEGVFRRAFGGGLETLALVGGASEPDPPNTTYGRVSRPPAIANDGTVAFWSYISGVNAAGIFVCDPATCPVPAMPVLVAQEGVADAADQPPNNDLVRFSAPGISDTGDVAFAASLVGASGRLKGIFRYRQATGLIETVALRNGVAPKVDAGDPDAQFRRFVTPPRMSAGGRIAFQATVRRVSGTARLRRGIYASDASPSAAFLDLGPDLLS
jgi:hypothetical protein